MLRAALTSALHRPAVQASHSKTAWLLRFPGGRAHTRNNVATCTQAALARPGPEPCTATVSRAAPTTSADRAVEPTFLSDSNTGSLGGATRRPSHRPHVKILDPDHVEPPRQVSGGLLHPVFTPIPLASFQFRDRPFRFRAAVGPTLASGQPLLQHLQPLRLLGSDRVRTAVAGRQRGRHTTPRSTPTTLASPGPQRVGDVRERDMPAACSITGNPVGLHPGWHRARQAKPHPPDLGHPDPTKATVELLDMMRSQRRPVESLHAHRLYAKPGGDACRQKSSASPGRNPATPAAEPSDSQHEATRIGARLRQLRDCSRKPGALRPGCQCRCCSTARFHTYRASLQ